MTTQPVILLNIAETVPVLKGLALYVLAEGNENSRRMEDYESCMKFYVTTTNVTTGERVKMKFALHGRMVARRGVGVDYAFVMEKIVSTLKEWLTAHSLKITDDAEPGLQMTRAVWRYIFGAGTRASSFANGVGIFSQPEGTNFDVAVDDLAKLQKSAGTFTLAIANQRMVKFYLGEEPPVWGNSAQAGGDKDDEMWWPCKKKVTPNIIDDCIQHFVNLICPENENLQVFAADKFSDLVEYVEEAIRQNGQVAPVSCEPQALVEEEPKSPGLLQRFREAVGIDARGG
jgi:hypothetical protein